MGIWLAWVTWTRKPRTFWFSGRGRVARLRVVMDVKNLDEHVDTVLSAAD